jgi:hypothetical protein
VPVATNAFPAAIATAGVAAVAPAATRTARLKAPGHGDACTALNPCAVSAPPARG